MAIAVDENAWKVPGFLLLSCCWLSIKGLVFRLTVGGAETGSDDGTLKAIFLSWNVTPCSAVELQTKMNEMGWRLGNIRHLYYLLRELLEEDVNLCESSDCSMLHSSMASKGENFFAFLQDFLLVLGDSLGGWQWFADPAVLLGNGLQLDTFMMLSSRSKLSAYVIVTWGNFPLTFADSWWCPFSPVFRN